MARSADSRRVAGRLGRADHPLLDAARLIVTIVALCAAGAALGADPDAARTARANRLIDSGSPYLLQHARNPVDWYPWGEEALARAKRENKPIFLSVGYSTCYWCHVANRTLYSDPAIAALMNRWFVNVKVDREQRPDIDAIYMRATQLMTGRGGWPNNVFLTPDLKPFFGGSYFPPADDDFGRPGFVTVLRAVHEDWESRGDAIRSQADRVLAAMRGRPQTGPAGSGTAHPETWLRDAQRNAAERFDAAHGGFRFGGSESQFPHEPLLGMLAAAHRSSGDRSALEKLTATLDAIALGGLHDHVGGGFHRYSVDRAWSVPHFEKMLYNNAQLLGLYADAWSLTRRPLYRQVAMSTAAYLARRLAVPEGGFYTAEDAEVGGHEGASYLWSAAEISAVLGPWDAKRLLRVYELTPLAQERAAALAPEEERGVLRQPRTSAASAAAALAASAPLRAKLLAARDRRPQPLRDEKIIVAPNGMAIEALARAGRTFGEPRYVGLARRAAERIWTLAYDPRSRRLRHEIYQGRAQGEGFLDDYAQLASGFVALAEAVREPVWRTRAAQLADDLLRRFLRTSGGLSIALADNDLIIPPEENGDNAYPSGTSSAVALLLRLHASGDGERFRAAADRIIASLRPRLDAQPDLWPALVAAAASARRRDSLALGAQGVSELPDSAAHVSIEALARAAPRHDEIVVTVVIERGYHVNANPASYDYLVPTELILDGLAPSQAIYPAATLFRPAFARGGIKVYEGSVEIIARVPKGALRDGKALSGALKFQACNDEVCLPPASLPLTVRNSRSRPPGPVVTRPATGSAPPESRSRSD